jgi:hypothetical protein
MKTFEARYGKQIEMLDTIEKEWTEIKNNSPSIDDKPVNQSVYSQNQPATTSFSQQPRAL